MNPVPEPSARDPLDLEHRWGGPVFWVSLGAGTVLWLVHVAGMAALTPYSCDIRSTVWLHVLTAVTLLPTLAALVSPWRHWHSGEDEASGLRFLGGMGVLLNALFAAAIVGEWLPVFLIDVCAR